MDSVDVPADGADLVRGPREQLGGAHTARGAELVRWALGVTIAAIVILAAFSPLFKPGKLHVQDMYVDQLGYITTARILVDTGELRNGVLMPSQIQNPRFRAYMPGHFLALAGSYTLFGYNVFSTLLPSLASYVLVALGLFLIGNRLHGRWSGALAAFLFAFYPAEITYAFTAMAELTFTLAAVAAFAAFVHLPRRWWPFAPPILLALPFLFRETGAFLILPMAVLVFRARGLLLAGLATAGSVGSLVLINRWQIASGKLAASLAWVTGGRFNYYNAYPPPEPELSGGELLQGIVGNVERNLGILGEQFTNLPGELMPIGLIVLLALVPIVVVGGARRWRQDAFPLGAAALLVLVLGLTVTLYDTQAHKMMRTAMFTVPFVALALAGIVRPERFLNGGSRQGGLRQLPRSFLVAAALLVAGSSIICVRAGERMTRRDDEMAVASARLAELHDESTVIVGPPPAAPMYPIDHYPVLWSFHAANLSTYALILQQHQIGTILVEEPMPPAFLRPLGMRYKTSLDIGDRTFLVYQPGPRRRKR